MKIHRLIVWRLRIHICHIRLSPLCSTDSILLTCPNRCLALPLAVYCLGAWSILSRRLKYILLVHSNALIWLLHTVVWIFHTVVWRYQISSKAKSITCNCIRWCYHWPVILYWHCLSSISSWRLRIYMSRADKLYVFVQEAICLGPRSYMCCSYQALVWILQALACKLQSLVWILQGLVWGYQLSSTA